MLTVGVRELKQQTSRILRRVREERESIEITYHGEIIARLIPVNPKEPTTDEITAVLVNLNQLSAEISASWPDNVSALDAVNDVRRD